MLAELAALSLSADRLDEADVHARHAIALATQVGDRQGCVFALGLLATVAAQREQPDAPAACGARSRMMTPARR